MCFMGHLMIASNVSHHFTVINYTCKFFISSVTEHKVINTFTATIYSVSNQGTVSNSCMPPCTILPNVTYYSTLIITPVNCLYH